jgi:uncharacterized membrane protein HdeD (DUF308 family)
MNQKSWKNHITIDLFMVHVGVLFFTNVSVGLLASTEVVGFLTRGKGAVVGGVFAIP